MFRRLTGRALKLLAFAIGTLALAASVVSLVRWITLPSPYSAEGLLARADDLAWNNNWLAAFPVYLKAEQAFASKDDRSKALYAHVSQFAVKMKPATFQV
jgi:hypothetical protein